MAICTKNISNWTKQGEELQRKIEEEKQKKSEIETSWLASIEENLVQETNIGLQYADASYALDEEAQNLEAEDSMFDIKIRLVKKCLEKIKTKFPI